MPRPAAALVADALVFVSVSCEAGNDETERDALHMQVLAMLIDEAEKRLQNMQRRIQQSTMSELWHELA